MSQPLFRTMLGLIFLVFMFFFIVIGGAAGLFVNSVSDVIYESEAVIQIAPNWVVADQVDQETVAMLEQFSTVNHEQSLMSTKLIQSCLEQNNLSVLDSFARLSMPHSVDLVKKKLVVKTKPETNNVFTLSLRLNDPQDTATVLNNLIKQYYDSLDSKFPDMSPDHFQFHNWQVARIGDQVFPLLPVNLSIGVGAGFLFGFVFWLLLNPFKTNPRQFSFLQFSLTFVVVSVGFAIGVGVVASFQPTNYASTAKLKITDDFDVKVASASQAERWIAKTAAMPHPVLLQQYSAVDTALANNNLFILDSFVDYSKEEVVNLVRENLSVNASPENPGILDVQLSLPIPEDSQVVLDALTQSYVDWLRERDADLLRNYNRSKLPADQKDEWGSDVVVGIPIQHDFEILEQASVAKASAGNWGIGIPELLAGAATSLVCLLACLAWFYASVSTLGKHDNMSNANRPIPS